jgi:hypothetical protein
MRFALSELWFRSNFVTAKSLFENSGMVQTIFTNLTADGRPQTAILLQRGGLRSAVRCQEIVKRRFQGLVNHAGFSKVTADILTTLEKP